MTGQSDLWEYLSGSRKKIVMYGMGNGADKILGVCAERNIEISDFFASDGFVRGHLFHGKKVLSYSEVCDRYGRDNIIVLVAFGTSLPDVMENIVRISRETELYIPDVPVFGDELFDSRFFGEHQSEIEEARSLFSDGESVRIYDNMIAYKLSGKCELLTGSVSRPEEILTTVFGGRDIRTYADLGAYRGETVREAAGCFPGLERVFAFEPDRRNFRKLLEYGVSEKRFSVSAFNCAAWNRDCTLYSVDSGNRNSFVTETEPGNCRFTEIAGRRADSVIGETKTDYIKYDVEGSELTALEGSSRVIGRDLPVLLVSVYHRSEDLFGIPLYLRDRYPGYTRFYLRRMNGFPAWDINLYAVSG